MLKLQMLSYQSREFRKFFCAINCCTYGFRGILVFVKIFSRNFCEHCFRKIMRRFSIFCFIHFREISGKQLCEMPTEILSFFRETFRLLETLFAMIYRDEKIRIHDKDFTPFFKNVVSSFYLGCKLFAVFSTRTRYI